ncbi:hypothetical protein IFM47457_08098 [Aspergillus lentulus]|nr:hypothetical protein IFM47457_08098 [Aspergillus lentulus]
MSNQPKLATVLIIDNGETSQSVKPSGNIWLGNPHPSRTSREEDSPFGLKGGGSSAESSGVDSREGTYSRTQKYGGVSFGMIGTMYRSGT